MELLQKGRHGMTQQKEMSNLRNLFITSAAKDLFVSTVSIAEGAAIWYALGRRSPRMADREDARASGG